MIYQTCENCKEAIEGGCLRFKKGQPCQKVIKRGAISERITTIISKMNEDVAKHEGDKMWQNQIKKDAIDRLDALQFNGASLREMVDASAWRRELKSELSN